MTASTSYDELTINDARATSVELWVLHNVTLKQIQNIRWRNADDNGPLPAVDPRRSYRFMILSMLIMGTRNRINTEDCRTVIIGRDGQVDEKLFADVWADLKSVVAAVCYGEADTYRILTRWANE